MTKRRQGFRKKTRALMRKNARDKGKIKLGRYFAEFNKDDRVLLLAEPGVQSGMYHPRYHGRLATVLNKKGSCYDVEIRDGSVRKVMSVHPVHLRKE